MHSTRGFLRSCSALVGAVLLLGMSLTAGVAQAAAADWSGETSIGPAAAIPSVITAQEQSRPSPKWYTPELHRRVLQAGPRGVTVRAFNEFCQGVNDPADPLFRGVQAGGCMVSPGGCTMSFVFTDSQGSKYIGTAGHCVGKVGDPVVMQIAARADVTDATLVKIGNVTKFTDNGIGSDFALVKIDPGLAVSPRMPVVGGPRGIFCGTGTGTPISHYGHGYHVEVQQGYPRAGVTSNSGLIGTGSNGYEWQGFVLGGDSGSGVVHAADGRAVGNLTHGLGIGPGGLVPIPGPSFGMRMPAIMSYLGSGYSLVNADGSTSSGCGSTTPPPPTGNQAPVAAFSVSCSGTACTFDGSGSSDSDGTITSYAWSFGDGGTGTGSRVSHTYPASAATYNVTLTVTDDDGARDDVVQSVSCSRHKKQGYICR